jgi:ParB/Sulfiredoxin domain
MTTTPPTTTTPPQQPKADYEFHPIANIFPLMTGQEFDRFRDDIKAKKLQEPIIIHENKILDGRNRYNACKELRLTPDIKPYDGYDPLGFVLSANLHRRHLNESQRAMVAAKLVTTKLGDNQHIKKEGRPIDQPTAAHMLNVSAKSVQRAKEVVDKATPNIQALVENGKVPVSVAKEVAKLPREEQAGLNTSGAVAKAVKDERAREKREQEARAGPTENSDKVDDLVDALINELKKMKAKNAETAAAAVADLMRRLQDADLYTEPKKKAA